MKYPHISARIFNTPLLIHPQKLDAIIAGLGPRILGGELVLHGGSSAEALAPADMLAPELFSTRKGDRVKEAGWPGYRNVDGVAVVNANGALVHKTALDMNTSSMLLGYNDLTAAMEHAAQNPDVHAILQVWDSPGGEVQGAFEHAQRMFDLRGTKPMYSIADGMAASAAMLGASASDKVFVTPTGYTGSIGVVMRHVDFSRMLANDGIAVTHIFAGAHKVDGNQFEPLPAAVRADLQAEINNLYDMFAAAMARHMGLSEEAIRNTEARVFMGQAAVDAGLAHGVTTTDALLADLAAKRPSLFPAGGSGSAHTKGNSMSASQAAAGGTQPANQPALSQADIDKARAEGFAAGKTEGKTEGIAEGAKAECERVSGILAHKEVAGRTALAHQCIATGLTVEQAGSLLAAAPKEAAAAANPLAAAMAGVGNPKVSGVEGQDADLEGAAAITSSWDKAIAKASTGVKRAH